MRKMLSILFSLAIALSFTLSTEAATTSTNKSSSATLYTNETSKSTARVTASQWAQFSVVNTGKQQVSYRIFKNGKAVSNHIFVKPGKQATAKELTGGKKQQYSIRTYCKSSTGKGCKSNFSVLAH